MPSIRNIISHLLVLTTMVYLGSCKPISETATILVTDLTTGVDFGCLTASAQVQSIGPPCATFTAVAAKGGDATIQDEPGLSLGFEPGDPSNSTTPEDLLFDISTFISNTWSLKGNVLSTDPEGSVFQQLADSFVQVGPVGTTTPISLNWINV